ncbi:hypothetical protein OG874_26025 [Nocardia sp. NBC_00565]|uniref:hypothetical protein n=1 Tax=Nocardia sp. NBC_00565 TaxID=2975993 RepID=UPI002E80E198|nr:hypothetical protein [Nocardia sp. NBC_00565]WUC00349.1 hypothetical protein OG874_26025 [Nocardia sp. NBC_00565]
MTERLGLADLPERGPRIADRAGAAQPYNEAAFDPYDPSISRILALDRNRRTLATANIIDYGEEPENPALDDDNEIEIPDR